MVQKQKFKNTTKKECIYGWYPPAETQIVNETSKDVYSNLGSRAPKPQSNLEAQTLYDYHQSVKHSDLIYKPKQSVEEALKPPWSLNLKTTGEFSENAEKTIPEAFSYRRTKSAPVISHVPSQRVILKIPTPQLQNLFSRDFDDDQMSNSSNDKAVFESSDLEIENSKNNFQISDIVPQEQIKLLNINEDAQVIITHASSNMEKQIAQEKERNQAENLKAEAKSYLKKVIVASNHGKKSMIFDEKPKESGKFMTRPKTANSTFRRPGSSLSRSNSTVERPKTALGENKNQSIEGKAQPIEPENSITLQNILKLNSGQTEQPGTQFQYGNYYNNKSAQKTLSKSTDPTVIYIDPMWVDKYLKNKSLQTPDYKLIDGHWKDQLINRSKFLQKRPNYFVKINLDKLKPDPPAPEVHFKDANTFFYNTLPHRKATFTVNPHFISEHLNVKKLELQNRPPSTNGSSSNNGPIRYRRDYAFAY